MRSHAIGDGLDQRGATSRSCPLGGVGHHGIAGQYVIAVDDDSGHPVAVSAVGDRRCPNCRRTGVEIAHWLFWTKKTQGACSTAARFIASWVSPSLVAPSPRNATVTESSFNLWAAIAAPLHAGRGLRLEWRSGRSTYG